MTTSDEVINVRTQLGFAAKLGSVSHVTKPSAFKKAYEYSSELVEYIVHVLLKGKKDDIDYVWQHCRYNLVGMRVWLRAYYTFVVREKDTRSVVKHNMAALQGMTAVLANEICNAYNLSIDLTPFFLDERGDVRTTIVDDAIGRVIVAFSQRDAAEKSFWTGLAGDPKREECAETVLRKDMKYYMLQSQEIAMMSKKKEADAVSEAVAMQHTAEPVQIARMSISSGWLDVPEPTQEAPRLQRTQSVRVAARPREVEQERRRPQTARSARPATAEDEFLARKKEEITQRNIEALRNSEPKEAWTEDAVNAKQQQLQVYQKPASQMPELTKQVGQLNLSDTTNSVAAAAGRKKKW